MIRRPPRSTHCISSAASDVYKRQLYILLTLQRRLLLPITLSLTSSSNFSCKHSTSSCNCLESLDFFSFLISSSIFLFCLSKATASSEYDYDMQRVYCDGNFGFL
eukprot:TRINITY_DN9844_c0_g1_i3.p1 TRINITY_DN9844_c0_g1~~TRINITY_DN9844_c0_g1_i3.p1  ORF type:complete len:114 (-),score=17.84 TRINITY_DN9844_c0_g1_i3:223-537(-)